MTVAFDIKNPFVRPRHGYRPSLLTIWHKDPERDGTDDSCGWFARSRHCDPEVIRKTAADFAFQWTHGTPVGWFDENDDPNYSPLAITLGMFRIAANHVFGHWSRRADRFLRRHVFEILRFGENSCDSLFTFITQPYGKDHRATVESRASEAARIVVPWIVRADRPWWRHPRWHVWHWRLQLHPWQGLVARYWTRCCVCGRRGRAAGEHWVANWNGDRVWHQACDPDTHRETTQGN